MSEKQAKKNPDGAFDSLPGAEKKGLSVRIHIFILLVFFPFLLMMLALSGFFFVEFTKVREGSEHLVQTAMPTILHAQRNFINIDNLKNLLSDIHKSQDDKTAHISYINATAFLSELYLDDRYYTGDVIRKIELQLYTFWQSRLNLGELRDKYLNTILKLNHVRYVIDLESKNEPDIEGDDNWDRGILTVSQSLSSFNYDASGRITAEIDKIRLTCGTQKFDKRNLSCMLFNKLAHEYIDVRENFLSSQSGFNMLYKSLLEDIDGLIMQSTQSETRYLTEGLKSIAETARSGLPLIIAALLSVALWTVLAYFLLYRFISRPLHDIEVIISVFRKKRVRPRSFPKTPLMEIRAINGVLPKIFEDVNTQARVIQSQNVNYQQLLNISYKDELTGVKNRRALDTLIERLDTVPSGLAILMIDIDNFKAFNDEKGHQYGDFVLATIGRQLKASVANEDCVYRYGGEEFLIILQEVQNRMPQEIGLRLGTVIYSLGIENRANTTGMLTISIGSSLVTSRDGEYQLEELIKQADIALYRAKAGGRNRVVLYKDIADAENAAQDPKPQSETDSPDGA